MPTAHLYLFSDACPTDWITDGHDDEWHSIVNCLFQSDPNLQGLVIQGDSHEIVLQLDQEYLSMVHSLERLLPRRRLRKWARSGSYKAQFCKAFLEVASMRRLMFNALSYQERDLRASKSALLRSYNQILGGVEGRGIGFEETVDTKGRVVMKHAYVNLTGYHEITATENKMLVLLLMSYYVADQYMFYRSKILADEFMGYKHVAMTVVSDRLSGDDDVRRFSEQNLINLSDSHHLGSPIRITRSKQSDKFSGDLLADNLAGWVTESAINPDGDLAASLKELQYLGYSDGRYRLPRCHDVIRFERFSF